MIKIKNLNTDLVLTVTKGAFKQVFEASGWTPAEAVAPAKEVKAKSFLDEDDDEAPVRRKPRSEKN